jgi:hypothetical protein
MCGFRIYVDREGKMPQLKRNGSNSPNPETHPYYVEYANGKPIKYHGPIEVLATRVTTDQTLKLYDYKENKFVDTNGVIPV